MTTRIRIASLRDVAELRELISVSVSALSAEYYTADQIESALLHIFGVDTQLISDQTYFVSEVESTIVGSGGWSKRRTLFGGDQMKASANDPLLDPAVDAARIRAFYVHPQWSRQGVGSAILKACENAALAAGFKRVELVATLPGVPFYEARGYQAGEPIQMAMPGGDSLPGVRMEKFLKKFV